MCPIFNHKNLLLNLKTYKLDYQHKYELVLLLYWINLPFYILK